MKMIFLVSCSVYGFITHACQFQQGICSLLLIIVITILNNRSKSCLDSRKSELLHRDDVFVTEEFFFFLVGGGGERQNWCPQIAGYIHRSRICMH